MVVAWGVFTSTIQADSFGPGYSRAQCQEVNANRRQILDFKDATATCTDDSTNNRTKVSLLGSSGAELDLTPTSGNAFEIYADTASRLWIVNKTGGNVLMNWDAAGAPFLPGIVCTGGNFLVAITPTGRLYCTASGSGVGTVTSITAGNQLTGGTITTSGTIAVSTTPSFTSLTLSATTPQLQLTPSSGNAHELYDSNSVVYLVNTTTGQVLFAFDAAGAPFLPGLTCTGTNTVVNVTSTGRLLCGAGGGGGSGTVTSITAGTGLSGGTITVSGTIALVTPVTAANGGTGNTTNTLNGVLYGNGGSAILATTQGASNTVLTANAGAPSFSATPTINSLTLNTTTPQLQFTAGSGNGFEFSLNASVFSLADTTNAKQIFEVQPDDSLRFGQLTTCSGLSNGGKLTTNVDGRVVCAADVSGGAGSTPGGSNTQVQYNSSSTFAGSSGITLNSTQATNINLLTDLDFIPAAGNSWEEYGSKSVWYHTNRTNGKILQMFDANDQLTFPQITSCDKGFLTVTLNGLISCVAPTYFAPGLFGDGVDGAVTLSVNTTLTRPMYYSSLTINSGVVVTTDNMAIYVSGTLTNNGTIRCDGGNGGDASGITGGTSPTGGCNADGNISTMEMNNLSLQSSNGKNGGTAAGTNGNTLSVVGMVPNAGGVGGTGGTGSSGSGGTGGAITYTNLSKRVASLSFGNVYLYVSSNSATILQTGCAGDAGGSGGGDGTAGGGSGAGANSGGNVRIYANTINNASGIIQAIGGNGGAGGTPAGGNRGGGGGGGGGSGGVVRLVYTSLLGPGTINVNGGSGGAFGSLQGTGTNGSVGNPGGKGLILKYNVTIGAFDP